MRLPTGLSLMPPGLRRSVLAGLLTALPLFSGSIYVTNELPNTNSPVSSVSAYDLGTAAFLGNLVPLAAYDLPDAIAVDPAHNVWVADAGADRVVEFDGSAHQVAVYDTQTGSAVSPTGLAVDPAGNVYASVLNGTIQKISGGTVTTIGTVPFQARGIAYDPYNALLYITTQWGGDIYTMPLTGGPATLFAAGLGSGNLRGLAFGNGNLYVSDTTYSHTAGAVYQFTGSSNSPVLFAGNLQGPNYIAIDPAGNLYIAEYYGNDVVKFAANGAGYGAYITGLHGPSGIAIDPAPEPATLAATIGGVLLLLAVRRLGRAAPGGAR